MKNVTLLVWLTQLGLSVAVPPVCFILLAIWLRDSLNWGVWVLWVGVGFGVYSAVVGFLSSLKTLHSLSKDEKKDVPISYNDHQ